MSRKILVLILVVLAASGAAFYYARSNRARGVVLTGIVTTDEIVVSSQIQGQINQLLVKEGDVVARGRKIAESGSTGRSTGPHLHFEVRFRGAAQNPSKFLLASNPSSQAARAK